MAPPRRYLTEVIADALRQARSLKAASDLLGMSYGALRKRALRDPDLAPLARRCIARGRAITGQKTDSLLHEGQR